MQFAPRYDDVVREVTDFLEERVAHAVENGVALDRIVVDPGIGFGKDLEHNLALLRQLRELAALGRPVLVGMSRKSFLGGLEGPPGSSRPPAGPGSRLAGSLAAATAAVLAGAHMVRVHDVLETFRAVLVADAIRGDRKTHAPGTRDSLKGSDDLG